MYKHTRNEVLTHHPKGMSYFNKKDSNASEGWHNSKPMKKNFHSLTFILGRISLIFQNPLFYTSFYRNFGFTEVTGTQK